MRSGASLLLLLVFAAPASAGEIPLAERQSGYQTMGRDTRAIEDDDTANPGMLWVLDGEALWNRRDGTGKSCADCHGDAAIGMKGVAARYPMIDAQSGKAMDLEARINDERRLRQNLPPLAYESKDLLALTSYIARQSRGMPINVAEDAATRAVIATGRALFEQRQGQISLSCAECHDDNWGKSLAGAPIPQAHPTGYPLYRLEWQSLGSLQRRLRNCIVGLRAEPYAFGSEEYVALELYLMWRARGMAMDSPGVRP